MICSPRLGSVLSLLIAGTCFAVQAQPSASVQTVRSSSSTTTTPELALQRASFAAAHDSLMHRVAGIRAQAEARMTLFKASQGTMGGLHRRIYTFAYKSVGNDAGNGLLAGLIKRQIIKHRYGVELEKVVYYDAQRRKVLSERYEDHQLTRLELFEYQSSFHSPAATWLFVQGDYLTHRFSQLGPGGNKTRNSRYFFYPRTAGVQ